MGQAATWQSSELVQPQEHRPGSYMIIFRWRRPTGDGQFDAKDPTIPGFVISCFLAVLCVVVLRQMSTLDLSRWFLRVYVLYCPGL